MRLIMQQCGRLPSLEKVIRSSLHLRAHGSTDVGLSVLRRSWTALFRCGFLRRYWCCVDILSFKRRRVLQKFPRCHTENVFVSVSMCVCIYIFILFFIFSVTVCVQYFCWCFHTAAPKRGRLFHLIEGQYLHEHSYRQPSQLGLNGTQATTVLQ